MYKIASVALTAALGIAGVAKSVPAEAHPYVSVAIGLPGVAVVAPVAYAPDYYGYTPAYYRPYYANGRYWQRGDRDRDERFHRRWDRDGDHGWDRGARR
jgi:hypothetical protein